MDKWQERNNLLKAKAGTQTQDKTAWGKRANALNMSFVSPADIPPFGGAEFADPSNISPPSKRKAVRPPEVAAPWRFIQRIGSLGGKSIWKGLGILTWPLERIEYTLATPLTTLAEQRAITKARTGKRGLALVFGPMPEAEAKREVSTIRDATIAALKTWIPGREIPEEARTWNDFWSGYYTEVVGEDAPDWYKWTAGTTTSFAVDPWVQGKLLKTAWKGVKPLADIRKAKSLPEWQRAVLRAKAKTGMRAVKAEEIGRGLAKKDMKILAKELSERTGTIITPEAAKLRVGQIIKGGITQFPEIEKAAHPAIQEFAANAKTLQRFGILPERVYTTKLSRKEIAELVSKKTKLIKQIEKIETPPYQKSLLKAAQKLTPDTKKQKRLANKLIDIAIKAEAKGKKITGEEFIDAAVNITTGSPLSKKISILLDFAPGDKRLTLLGKKILSLERLERKARNKQADVIIKLASKINPQVSKFVNKTVDDVIKVAAAVEDSKVIGKAPLIKKIASMKRRFPGKAEKIKKLQEQIDKITESIRTSYEFGGTKYFPRLYAEKEALFPRIRLRRARRITAKYAKKRERIPFEVRKRMGEIKEPAYPVMKRLVQEGTDIETAKLFEFAAKQPGWTSTVWQKGLAKKALPDNKSYGALRNLFVHPKVYEDVTQIVEARNNFARLYDTVIGTWKLGKVVWNPATHFRNKISNKMLLDLSGMGYVEQAKYARKAWQHYKEGSKDYKLAKLYFARTTAVKGELLDDVLRTTGSTQAKGLAGAIDDINSFIKKTSAKPSAMYQHEEFVNKFMKYLQQRDKGKSVIEAVEEANKWLFDYSELAKWERQIMRRVMPFYCVPDDTEILTKTGWKRRGNLSIGDLALTYNIQKDKTEWQPIFDIAQFDFDGQLSVMQNKHHSWRFTNEHRFPCIGWLGKHSIKPFNQLNTSHKIPLSRKAVLPKNSILSPKDAAILGWLVTDGYFRKRGNNYEMMIYQSPKKYLCEIKQLLGKELQSESIHPQTGVVCCRFKQTLIKRLTKIFRSKKDFPYIVCNLSKPALLATYDAMFKAEGCYSGRGDEIQFCQKLGPIMDGFQIICTLLGRPFNISLRANDNIAYGYVKHRDNICIKDTTTSKSYYKGIVWCPRTKNQTWIMRQNGKIIITGNTFPRKALPRVLEAAAKRPHTVAKYPLAAKTITQYSLYKLNMTDEDYEKIKKDLPSYMKRGSYILMPYRDRNGDLRFFDWTYLVPWGELYEANERGLLKIGITNPLFQITADVTRNKSGWTDREIWKETDTTKERTFKQMQYLWQTLVPSLSYKGIYWDKLYEAATGKKSKLGKERLLPETIAHTIFGLRTQAIDEEMQRRFQMYNTKKKVQEIQSKMLDIIQRKSVGSITDEEFIQLRNQYLEQAQEFIKE